MENDLNGIYEDLEGGLAALISDEKKKWATDLKDEINDLIGSLIRSMAIMGNSPIPDPGAKRFCEGQIFTCQLFVKMLEEMAKDDSDSQ